MMSSCRTVVMVTLRRGHRLVAACTLLLATACEDLTGPPAAASTYVARTVNGAPLPAPLVQDASYENVLLADTLRLFSFGIAARVSIHRRTAAGGPSTTDTSRSQDQYTVRGDSIRFHQSCPPNAICAAPPEGVFAAEGRQLILRMWGFGPVVVYERVTN